DLEMLLSGKKGRILVTARRKEEGGNFRGSETERIALLRQAVRMGADLVDVELGTDETLTAMLLEEIHREGNHTKLIVSSHDFKGTPPYRTLQDLCNRCTARGADIVKIVTCADSMEDNLTILRLIAWAREKGQDIIALCMGERGTISRVMAPLLGSYLTFASLGEGEESAPGQLTAHEMQEIFRILGNES
ncbi:MAG: type I 3-dehydroquinate dehydratase, partial [Deltaproteobacteria bacterium]|nr:type I 3-dehydroquinate dehydratase [Deltaproteobacteria bacterium]